MSAVTVDKIAKADIKSFVTSLVTNIAILIIEVGLFSYLRNHVRKIYAPRVFLPPTARRSPPISKGFFAWIPAIIRAHSSEVIHKNGLDAYFMLKFLYMLLKIFAVSTVATFIVLVPINIAHDEQLAEDYFRIAWGNIPDELSVRYTAHVCIAYALTAYVLYLLQAELRHLTSLRHAYLTSKAHTKHAQSRTVLITGIPKTLLTEKDMRQFASFVPGGIARVWIYRASKALSELFEDRLEVCQKLEGAITHMLTKATKITNKRMKKALKSSKEVAQPVASYEALNELVPPAKRPQHKVGLMGVFGQKVDTIEWAKKEIPRLDREIMAARKNLPNLEAAGSAFVELNLQLGAHVLTQCVSYHEPLAMTDKWTEVAPDDVIWDNIDDGSYEVRARFILSWAATFGLIIVFGIPVLAIQSLGNLSKLCIDVTWLAWVCKAPTVATGLLQGVLPPLLMAILFLLVPYLLRALSWFECVPRYTIVSQRVYDRYFIFLVVHGFLVAFLAGGLTQAIPRMVKNPPDAVKELANNLPKASTYFMTYIMASGMTGAGSAFLQVVPLAMHYLKKKWLGRTPREAYGVSLVMPSIDFGVVLPPISLLATIGLSYVVINPLLNVVSTLAVAVLWFAYKYLFLYVLDQPESRETGGLYFPRAISNLFVGLYITQGTIATLLFLRLGIDGAKVTSAIQGAFMVLLLILTGIYHAYLNQSFSIIVENLPMSLATRKMKERFDRERKRNGLESALPDDMDLFNREHIRSVLKRRVQRTTSAIQQELREHSLTRKALSTASSLAGSSSSVNRHPGSPSTAMPPTLTVTSPSSPPFPPPPPPPPFPGSHEESPEDIVRNAEVDSDSDDDELDDLAFTHPAQYKPAPWIWVPRDPFGYSELVVKDLKRAGVEASDEGASLDKQGIVKVIRNPPDETWDGGVNI